jgi:hypothetical protein
MPETLASGIAGEKNGHGKMGWFRCSSGGEKAPKSGISCAAVSGNGSQGVHTRTPSGTKQEASEKCFKFLQEWDLFDFQGHNILSTIS